MPHDELDQVLAAVREVLEEESRSLGYRLTIQEDGVVREGEWSNVLVSPSVEGVHAADYAEALARADRRLRERGIDRVLLVPAKPGASV